MTKNKLNKRIKHMISNVNVLYRYFVTDKEEKLEEIIKNKTYIVNTKEITEIFNNIENIITIVDAFISSSWTFERLDNLHKAILVNGVYEIRYKKTDKILAINESIDIAKLFAIDGNYKYINAVLDNL